MGTGSFDYSLLFNYLVRNEKWGLQVQTSFDLKGVNRFDYKFGNQSDSNLRLLIGNRVVLGDYFVVTPPRAVSTLSTGSHSSILFPAGSRMWTNFPYG